MPNDPTLIQPSMKVRFAGIAAVRKHRDPSYLRLDDSEEGILLLGDNQNPGGVTIS